MCVWVCVSLFQCGGLGNYLFGIPGQSFTARPRGSDWKRAGYWLSDPPTSSPLLFTHPSLLLHPFFFLTEAYSRPFFTFIDSLLQTSWPYSPPHLDRQTPSFLISSLCKMQQLKQKTHKITPAWLYFWGNKNQTGITAWVCWTCPALPFQRLHWKHAAICSLTWRLLWTDLPEELRAAKSVSSFKLLCKTPFL